MLFLTVRCLEIEADWPCSYLERNVCVKTDLRVAVSPICGNQNTDLAAKKLEK